MLRLNEWALFFFDGYEQYMKKRFNQKRHIEGVLNRKKKAGTSRDRSRSLF